MPYAKPLSIIKQLINPKQIHTQVYDEISPFVEDDIQFKVIIT